MGELMVLQNIRAAVGDEGRMMQDELLQHIESMASLTSPSVLGTLLIFAARYAHSRPTGGALQVVNAIEKAWGLLDERTKEQLVREANHEATCNREDWERVIRLKPSAAMT